jgi:hypothetical protein
MHRWSPKHADGPAGRHILTDRDDDRDDDGHGDATTDSQRHRNANGISLSLHARQLLGPPPV